MTRSEQMAQDLIEVFEDFLRVRDIRIPSSDEAMKADNDFDGNDAIIYGDDYGELQKDIADTLEWAMLGAIAGMNGGRA